MILTLFFGRGNRCRYDMMLPSPVNGCDINVQHMVKSLQAFSTISLTWIIQIVSLNPFSEGA